MAVLAVHHAMAGHGRYDGLAVMAGHDGHGRCSRPWPAMAVMAVIDGHGRPWPGESKDSKSIYDLYEKMKRDNKNERRT
jgi:hypothetical protein